VVDLYGDEMRIDVVILTKNNANNVFDKCLASIKQNIPVHHLIVVDAFFY
jgi:glycosyltransferase involved in cell wall biosynthesis